MYHITLFLLCKVLGFAVDVAVRDAKAYVAGALAAGLNLGRGSGPLDHMWQYGAPMPC